MATTYTTVEVVVMVDSNGDIGVGRDGSEAVESYEQGIQPVCDASGMRQVVLKVRVPLPTPLELSGELEEEEADAAWGPNQSIRLGE